MATRFGELNLIQRIRSTAAAAPRTSARNIILGIGDDCALLRPPQGHELAVTTDMLLEGRHFRRDWHTPQSAGHRALARGLSDLAAMGARPLAAFLSLALPPDMLHTRAGRAWVDGFFAGLHALAQRSRVTLAGGDTAESPASFILADIVLIGSVPAGRALRRSTARPGHLLYVTGTLGGAAAELQALARQTTPARQTAPARHTAPTTVPGQHPQLFPEPRLSLGRALVTRRLATAAVDLSDGLSTDLAHLCRESHLDAAIEEAALPLHPLALAGSADRKHALNLALNGGEDYELLFAAPPRTALPRSIGGVLISRIGRLLPQSNPAKSTVTLIDPAGRRRILRPGGWEHLAGRS